MPSGAMLVTRQDRLAWVFLGLLILLAIALRLYGLSTQDLWGDEAFSISLSLRPLSQIVAGGADTHPPFYPLLLFSWLRLLGVPSGEAGAFITRALSALTGTLVVPLVFVFARRLATVRAAWIVTLLVAISPLLIYYSQETRMYELVTLLALAGAYFALRWIDHSRRAVSARDIAGYLIFTILAFYTHYSAVFLWVATTLYAMVRLRRERSALIRWAVLQAVLIAAYLPWIMIQTSFLQTKTNARYEEWGWRGIELVGGKTLLAFAAGLTLDAPIAHVAGVAFLALAAVGAWALAQGASISPRPWLAPLLFVVPVAIAWVVNPIMPFYFERYVLVALPAFYLTAALGLDYVMTRWARAGAVALGICVLISAGALSNYYWNDAYAKGKYGQMMTYIQERVQPGDALILNNPLQKPLFDYYRPRSIPAFYLPEDTPLEDPRTRQQLDDIARAQARLWLVMFGNPAEYDPTGYLERWLGAHAFKSLTRGFVDASLSLYVMPGATPAVQRTVGARLGENIQLVGYELSSERIEPGQILQLSLQWRALAPAEKRYKVFTHLIGAPNPATQSPVWAQMDGEPVGGSRPTTQWQVSETVDDRYGLEVPSDAPSGDYVLEVGMYDPVILERLPAYDAAGVRLPEDRVVLGIVKVESNHGR